MANVPNGVKILPKIAIVWVWCTNVTHDRRQMTDGRAMAYSENVRAPFPSHRAVFVKFSLFKCILSYSLWEYHDKSFIYVAENLIDICVADSMSIPSTVLASFIRPITAYAIKFVKTTKINTIEGHSRSPLSVPMESPYIQFSDYWSYFGNNTAWASL